MKISTKRLLIFACVVGILGVYTAVVKSNNSQAVNLATKNANPSILFEKFYFNDGFVTNIQASVDGPLGRANASSVNVVSNNNVSLVCAEDIGKYCGSGVACVKYKDKAKTITMYLNQTWCNSVKPPITNVTGYEKVAAVINRISRPPFSINQSGTSADIEDQRYLAATLACGGIHELQHIKDLMKSPTYEESMNRENKAYQLTLGCYNSVYSYYCRGPEKRWNSSGYACNAVYKSKLQSEILIELVKQVDNINKKGITDGCYAYKPVFDKAKEIGYSVANPDKYDLQLQSAISSWINAYINTKTTKLCSNSITPTPSSSITTRPRLTPSPTVRPSSTPKVSPTSTVKPSPTSKML